MEHQQKLQTTTTRTRERQSERKSMENQQKKLQSSHNKNKSSISDTESQTSQVDSFYSPLRSDSPLCSDDPIKSPEKSLPSKAIVAVDKYNSPVRFLTHNHRKTFAPPAGIFPPPPPPPLPPVTVFNRSVREEVAAGVTKVGPARVEEGFGDGEDGGERRSRAAEVPAMRREVAVNRAALGFRVCEMIFCLISFSVMAADKTQGWAGDSFDRYMEYRYCLAVTVIGFVYSGFQAYDLAHHLITGKHVIPHHLRYHFDFLMDQILAYLLISASSSAATRVVDWISNWGKDDFTMMASASVGMSFLAFVAFAFSSLISGYNLCNRNCIA